MNLATTPQIPNGGALQRHMQRHPEDAPLEALLNGIFASLEQADILGSLLRPREYLEAAIEALQHPQTLSMEMSGSEADWYLSIKELARHDADELTRRLLERVSLSFQAEVKNSDDVSAALFGRAALEGVKLLGLLMRRYAIVVTNPPYMGSKNMDVPLKRYVEHHYSSGKRDLYAAFILRCLELCQPNGRVAMVTMQSWMFLRSFVDLRAIPEDRLVGEQNKHRFTGLLRETSIEVLAHLGPNAFEEINGEVVKSVMYVLLNQAPSNLHLLKAFRLIKINKSLEKADTLKKNVRMRNLIFSVPQLSLLKVNVISTYHFPKVLLDILSNTSGVGSYGYAGWGVSSSNNDRFLRLWWEVKINGDRWVPHVKGGGYCKWYGFDYWTVEWRDYGIAIKTFIVERYPYLKGNYEIKVRSYTANQYGWTFSSMVGAGLSVRKLYPYQITNAKSPAIFLERDTPFLGGILNSIISTFILQGLTPSLNVDEGYVAYLPVKIEKKDILTDMVQIATLLKYVLKSHDVVERNYAPKNMVFKSFTIASDLHFIEGFINSVVVETYHLQKDNILQIQEETGTPAGWYPLITNYDALPALPDKLDLPPLPQELFEYLATHERVTLDEEELTRTKSRLKALYEAGQGAKEQESDEDNKAGEDEEEGEVLASGAYIPIPTETFLEELSVKMQLHPISVYWLLEELRAEGVRCKPEEKRLLEDRLSVLVLRLLGHRWPKQIEANEPVPAWAEHDGIIPLVAIPGKDTLVVRVRQRLIAEDGEIATQRTEALLQELTNYTLEEWLRRNFFPHHISQFKARPIAWHLTSTPMGNTPDGTKGKRRRSSTAQRRPAFECLLYYHACASDALARIRTQYVEPLIRAEQARIAGMSASSVSSIPSTTPVVQQLSLSENGEHEVSKKSDAETQKTQEQNLAADIATVRLHELRDFAEQLRGIEERGFACEEIAALLAQEPLDRWSGDGYTPATSYEAWQHAEAAWHVDINDGVRVNIAPLQLAGVLAKDVLAKRSDALKAITDRTHWRADERRWVRDGKLPRCGWLPEHVPASDQWLEVEQKRVPSNTEVAQQTLTLNEETP